MSELRRDPILRRWVIIAPERATGPRAARLPLPRLPEEGPCPFCPGNEAMNPEEIYRVRDHGTARWAVRVTPDKRPLLRIEGDLARQGSGMFDLMSPVGAHEIVTDTAVHTDQWADFSRTQLECLMGTYLARYRDLRGDPRFRHIVVMKNHGAPWSRYAHQHSHVVAMPFTPKRIEDEYGGAREYFRMKERCVLCDIVREELRAESRVVAVNDEFVAYAPFASGYPYETWIVPLRHMCDFDALGERGVAALAGVFLDTLRRLRAVLADPQFSLALHAGPLGGAWQADFHWHWELIPHLAGEVGLEWATGIYSNSLPPEEAARLLRDAVPPQVPSASSVS
jgi:UDPglucose--hexose-1-phosphate uridylyltransferase